MMQRLIILSLLALASLLSGCSGSIYFNTWFNLNRNYEMGHRERTARLDSLPKDTTWASESERKAWTKVIEKGGKILQFWPTDTRYKPEVLFRMAIAYYRLDQAGECLQKFDEYERYFPSDDSIPAAQYHRALCLERNNQQPLARFALEQVSSKPGPYREAALYELARISGQGQRNNLRKSLEALLATEGPPSLLRGRASLQLADIYFQDSLFSKARPLYLSASLELLPIAEQWIGLHKGALCLSYTQAPDSAATELLAIPERKGFAKYRTTAELLAAQSRLMGKTPEKGLSTLLAIAKKHPGQDTAAHAWYLLGNYEHERSLNLALALQHYDSSSYHNSQSSWGYLSRKRASSLREILAVRTLPDGRLNAEQVFRASETFWDDLNQSDSGLVLLQKIQNDSATDRNLRLKALYAEAFVRDAKLKDSTGSDSLYRRILQLYPGTEFAKQAQKNLGLEMTELTRADSATLAYHKAESLEIQLKEPSRVSEFLDTLILKYPGELATARALWLQAHLWQKAGRPVDHIRNLIVKLSQEYSSTPQGILALEILRSGDQIQTMDLTVEREILKQLERQLADLQRIRKEREEREAQGLPATDNKGEELLWDYNEMYQF
jgi:outer membrane protein assembly factor BamD (BamD/ComL family)